MTAGLIALLVATAAIAHAQDCTCEDEKTVGEATDIFTFLKRLSTDAETAENKMPTLPALLSPLVPCGSCVEISRKKRKIFPEHDSEEEIIKEEKTRIVEHDEERVPYPVHAGIRNKCPFGFVRIGFMCLSADLL